MNKKQLFLIFGVAIVLVGSVFMARTNRKATWQGQTAAETLLPSFPVNDVTGLEITGKSGSVKLVRKDDGWRVAERFDYPASFSTLKEFIVKIGELKAAQSVKVGASQYGRLNLEEPGKGESSGTKVVFYGKDGKALQTLVFGKEHSKKTEEGAQPNPMMGMMGGGGGSWPDGRYLLLPESNRVVLVSDSFSAVDPDPTRWLEKEFFKVTDLKDARLLAADQELWSVSRDSKTAELALAGPLPEGKEVDTGKLGSIKSAFGWASFTDVADPALKPEDTGMDAPKVYIARDFDGFAYTVRIGKETSDGKVHVQAEVAFAGPSERPADAAEKPEDKPKKDEEFAKKLQENKDKAEQMNRRLKGWTYVVSKYTVESVTKTREELLKDKAKPPEATPAAAAPAAEAVPAAAAEAIPAATPAVEVKAVEAVPAPAAEATPAATPAVEVKAVEAVPAPAETK